MLVSAMSGIICETTIAIWDELQGEFMKPPTRQQWEEISAEFWKKWNFPLCLGAINGKHIPIKCPPNSSSKFYNYKNFFSLILLVVVDADYKFTVIDIRGYGREGDAGLFHNVPFRQRLQNGCDSYENGGLDLPVENYIPGTTIQMPHIFLGNNAFPLQRQLMKPYCCHTASGAEASFNYRLSRAWQVVKNAFSILVTHWHALATRLDTAVELAEHIVKACCVLHNYLKLTDTINHAELMYVPVAYVDYKSKLGNVIPSQW